MCEMVQILTLRDDPALGRRALSCRCACCHLSPGVPCRPFTGLDNLRDSLRGFGSYRVHLIPFGL